MAMPESKATNRRDCIKTIASAAASLTLPIATTTQGANGAESERAPLPVVDTHMHVWSDDPRRFPFAHPYKPNFKQPPTPATMEMLLEDMDQNGVTHSILVQCIYHGWDNRYVAQCAKAHPSRFRAQGLIDPTDPNVAEKLEYWMIEHGFSGMRLSPIYYQGRDAWLNSPASRVLWKKAEDLGAIFNLFIASNQLPRLQDMVQRYPGVYVLIDHVAYIRADAPKKEQDKLLVLANVPNISVKFSELQSVSPGGKYPYRDSYDWLRRVYDAFGPDRILWGTGYPGAARARFNCPNLKQELDLIRQEIPFLTTEDKNKILGLNAARIWNLKV